MTYEDIVEQLLLNLREASKVLNMDDSHSSLRDNLQRQMAADHRANNPDSDSYYDYPYIVDVYGDGTKGVVVTSRKGNYAMHNFANDGASIKFSGTRPVKRAYVAQSAQQESETWIDGQLQESLVDGLQEEQFELKESTFDKDGYGNIKVIAPGHGTTGYYSADVLKEAAQRKVFAKGTQMFIDHATDAEDAARPEGSIRGLAAVLESDAHWDPNGSEGPGLYAKVKAYSDTKDFLNERAKDIGISIRAVGRGVTGQVGGRINRIVKSLVAAKSVDFVTKAGAGGKLLPLLESFREAKRSPATEENNMAEVKIDDKVLADLKESAGQVPVLKLQLDRFSERFAKIDAKDIAVRVLRESKLPQRAQNRVIDLIEDAAYALPFKEGAFDVPEFKTRLNKLIEDEAAYLKECGSTKTGVRGLPGGSGNVDLKTDAIQDATLEESAEFTKNLDKELNGDWSTLSGVKRDKK